MSTGQSVTSVADGSSQEVPHAHGCFSAESAGSFQHQHLHQKSSHLTWEADSELASS